MRISQGVEALELTMNFLGNQSIIHPTLIWDDKHVVLVDTGIPGQLSDIQRAMSQAEVPFGRLTTLILTHQDIDHVGSLPEVVAAAADSLKVLAHEEDRPYIEGNKPYIKMSQETISRIIETVPESNREELRQKLSILPIGEVTKTVADGEVLPYCGGITVVFTPGHTPGHISLYLNESKTLVAGDALTAVDGQLMGPSPRATLDMDAATKSLKKLSQYDIQTVICYHGGVVSGNMNQRIAELANDAQ